MKNKAYHGRKGCLTRDQLLKIKNRDSRKAKDVAYLKAKSCSRCMRVFMDFFQEAYGK